MTEESKETLPTQETSSETLTQEQGVKADSLVNIHVLVPIDIEGKKHPEDATYGIPDLTELARAVEAGKELFSTVRSMLSWFGAHRRSYRNVSTVRETLTQNKLRTDPDFEGAYIDEIIRFLPLKEAGVVATQAQRSEEKPSAETGGVMGEDTVSSTETPDPTYRIGKLRAANRKPESITPDATLTAAITKMIMNDYSQLPVMTSEREVKGMISWNSIGTRLALGRECKYVRDCTEEHKEINADTSIFEAVRDIISYECVLIRDAKRVITGIVTTSDLSEQFRQLGEPFLLLGEIENHVRMLIDGKFTNEELEEVKYPSDDQREINTVSDLTFGEYISLLENPNKWDKLHLNIDRTLFVLNLGKVREIRNDVMHFDPDGVAEEDMGTLRMFVQFLQRLRDI